jgi:hypothetical protein
VRRHTAVATAAMRLRRGVANWSCPSSGPVQAGRSCRPARPGCLLYRFSALPEGWILSGHPRALERTTEPRWIAGRPRNRLGSATSTRVRLANVHPQPRARQVRTGPQEMGLLGTNSALAETACRW